MSVSLLRKFPIQIHSWGGLGSQLFAVVLAYRIKDLYKNREIRIVFHTSGVTKRAWEIPTEALIFEVRTLDDFDKHSTIASSKARTFRRKLILIFKRTLSVLGVLADVNHEWEFKALTSRVLQIRGHYSQLRLEIHELETIWGLLYSPPNFPTFDQSCCIHLRLGDLLTIKSKSLVSTSSLGSAITNAREQNKGLALRIFSDSPEATVRKYLEEMEEARDFTYVSESSITLLLECTNATFFIGTNSKLSMWVYYFRSGLFEKNGTYLPQELKVQAFSNNLILY